MAIILSNYLKLKSLDKVSQFRLINAFFISIVMSLIAPVGVILKGTYMLAWIISLFSMSYIIAVKTNRFMVPLGNNTLYKLGIFLHMLYIICGILYFFNHELMIWTLCVLTFFEIVIISSYNVSLQNYITKYFPEDVPNFLIIKNETWADGNLIGLGLGTLFSLISLDLVMYVFIIFNVLFSAWMVRNWNFFPKNELTGNKV